MKLIWNLRKYRAELEAQIRKEMYLEQGGKEPWQAHCEVAFTDPDGRRYFRYVDESHIPILRFEAATKVIREISNRTSDQDLGLYVKAQRAILFGDGKANEKVGLLAKNLDMFDDRLQLLAPQELYFKLVSLWLIREDENPAVVDLEIEEQKQQDFISYCGDSNLAFFFGSLGLKKSLPSLEGLRVGSERQRKKSEEAIAAWRQSQTELADSTSG